MTRRRESVSLAQARRIAISAQGLDGRRPAAPGLRDVTSSIVRMGALQIDSVNVLARSQYLPLFARLGDYDPALLTRASERAPRRVVEYWAHMAAFVPVQTWPLLAWRMHRHAEEAWAGITRAATENPRIVEQVAAAVAQIGPATATELADHLGHSRARERTHWGWNWSIVKTVAEHLFFAGRIACAGRTSQFERIFDVPERVLPAAVLAQPVPAEADAVRGLVAIAARAHGIGTLACLRDYFRLKLAPTRRAVAELVDQGTLVPVRVQGWDQPAYVHTAARWPRQVGGQALLSPFDPLVWERTRTEALFGFRYRIEIYTPAHRRVHGYYVLPFLLDDALVARVDLKADRAASALLVQSAFAEPSAVSGTPAHGHATDRLADELERMASWLRLSHVRVADRGDLAGPLRTRLGHR